MERLDEKDPTLWRIAQKRAEFKQSLYSYVAINGFFWLIWYCTDGNFHGSFPWNAWPIWPMLGWGFGLAFEYHEAYHGNKSDLAEREYEKMKDQQKR